MDLHVRNLTADENRRLAVADARHGMSKSAYARMAIGRLAAPEAETVVASDTAVRFRIPADLVRAVEQRQAEHRANVAGLLREMIAETTRNRSELRRLYRIVHPDDGDAVDGERQRTASEVIRSARNPAKQVDGLHRRVHRPEGS
jgi:hypothetical protein